MTRSRLVAGPTFVSLGTVLLLDEARRGDAWVLIGQWWPIVLLLAAGSQLAIRPRHPVAASLLALVGGTALLVSLGLVGSAAVLWPLALIGIGLVVLARPTAVPTAVWTADGGTVAVFEDQQVRPPAGPYDGQTYTALFADLRLDLRAVAPSGDARVQLTSIFGDIEVELPDDWEVSVDGPRIFGQVRVDPAVQPGDDSPRLRLEVVAVFGDIRVRRSAVSVASVANGREAPRQR